MLFPLLTLARIYSVQAKPYGALLGWTGIALISWRYTAVESWRRWALVGLGTALACATSSHFFGALVGLPIIAGEAVRWYQRRRVDWVVSAVLTLNYWPLIFFVPILKAGSQIHGAHPWQSHLSVGFIAKSFDLLLVDAAAPVLLCVLAAALLRSARVTFPMDEVAAAAALALLPVPAFLGLRLVGIKVIDEKYLITMVVGIAILFAWSLYFVGRRSGIILVAILGVWGVRDFVRDLRFAEDQRQDVTHFSPPVAALPVVIEDPIFALYENYGSDRVYYLVDPPTQLKYAGNDALPRSFLLNPKFFGPHVETFATFNEAHRSFLIYERLAGETSWLLTKYKDDGARVELIRSSPDDHWYLVTQ
jgi:hypothetical protein